jgi:iron complex transport system substrate-binding protein
MQRDVEQLCELVVDISFKLHRDLGPGMLESAYEMILAQKLVSFGVEVDRQRSINISYDDLSIENAFRIDLLVDQKLIVEIKSLETIAPVHAKQVLTYLRLMNLPIGLLINFGGATFKGQVKRLVNNHTDFASSRLRANQK